LVRESFAKVIAKLKPYLAMKESGVPWLGRVPQHWSVLPNRAIFAEIKDRNHPDEEMLSVTITKGVVKQRELLADSSKKDSSNLDRSAYKLVLPRDIAYNKMRAWQGAIGASDYRGIISPAYVVMRLRGDANPRYFHHLYRTPQFAKEAERWSYGITSDMWSLRPEHFRLIYSLLPPPEEQDTILRFVEHADQRIRTYIRVKQNLINLLEEKKQAIILHAVSRGLSAGVRCGQNGVKWLGSVPAHWETKRLKSVFREVDHRSTEGTEVLLSLRMRRGLVPHTEVSDIPIGPSALVGFKKVFPGQLVMNRMRAAIGMFGIAPQEGLVSPDYAVFEPVGDINLDYFLNLFKTRSASAIFRIESKGLGTGSSGFMRLYTDRFGVIKVPVPPVDEQTAIVRAIAYQTANINTETERVRHELNLLRDYRTRLLADVVTGKLEVGDAGKGLPAEIKDTFPDTEPDEMAEEGQEGDDPEIADESEEAES
jgi:type I restriction enzyme, S subunit